MDFQSYTAASGIDSYPYRRQNSTGGGKKAQPAVDGECHPSVTIQFFLNAVLIICLLSQ
jgi:hypothetical protein